jgi:hypothetical protein
MSCTNLTCNKHLLHKDGIAWHCGYCMKPELVHDSAVVPGTPCCRVCPLCRMACVP